MGSLGGALGQVGEAAAASPVGQFISTAGREGVGSALGQFATNLGEQSGLANIGAGLQSLFGGGPDEAGYLQSLGQTVPTGVELAGPSPTFQGPGFFGSLIPGLQGGVEYANPSAETQLGQGVGQLIAMLEKMKQQGGGGLAPMTPVPGRATAGGVRMLPGYSQAGAPTGGLIHNLIGAFTYGILGGAIPSSQQV